MFRLAAVITALLFSLTPTVFAATQWHMPTPYPQGEHHTRNIVQFTDDVRSATNGEFDIVVHAGASLFKHPEIHRAVRGGQVPIGEMLMGALGNDEPLFKVDNIPFLVADFEGAGTLWKLSRPHLAKWLDTQGLVLLFAVPWPPQGLYATHETESLADIRGNKLRAYSPLTSRLAALLDASPVNVQAPEIPQAFATGIVEMMFTSSSTGVSSQAWDYAGFYIDTRAWIPKNMVIVNKRAVRRLPQAHRDALFTAAAAAEERGWEMARQETLKDTRKLAEMGMQVLEPAPQLQAELQAVGEILVKEWIEETGATGESIIKALQEEQQ